MTHEQIEALRSEATVDHVQHSDLQNGDLNYGYNVTRITPE